MDKILKYSLNIDNQPVIHSEAFIEKLFREWRVNEIYLGNVVTSFSNLIHLLIGHPENGMVDFIVRLKDEVLSFDIGGINAFVLSLFLKDYLLQEVSDNSSQSVFLIQKIADKVSVEGENLVLQFNTGALPDAYLNHRKQVLKSFQEEPREKNLND